MWGSFDVVVCEPSIITWSGGQGTYSPCKRLRLALLSCTYLIYLNFQIQNGHILRSALRFTLRRCPGLVRRFVALSEWVLLVPLLSLLASRPPIR